MTGLSEIRMAEIRALLADRKRQLVGEIEAKLAEAKGERVAPDTAANTDGGDKAFLDMASELDLTIVGRDVDELQQVDAAQSRLSDGSYGMCIECGGTIALERLLAQPTAERCTPCQSEIERRHGGVHAARL